MIFDLVMWAVFGTIIITALVLAIVAIGRGRKPKPQPVAAPAGWYPTPNGMHYWDGARWVA